MPRIPGKPLVWSPHTASDTLDSSTAGSGAMASLANLIPDPSTVDLWQSRPAAQSLANFSGSGFSSGFSSGFGGTWQSATFISCMTVVGSRAYGMVSTARFPGHDEPFIYDFSTQTFIPITGQTAVNTPLSPQTAGAWQPPHIELVGAKFIVTHSGFTGVANAFFGVLDISDPANPTWTATNTAPTALIAVPSWVSNFGGRAYFLVNPSTGQPAAYYSDALAPTVITLGTQILTFDDNTPLTCAAGLGLYTQLGGIIQSLLVFKSATNIYQITGDAALASNPLTVNSLNVATGTFAPNSLARSEKGLCFMAPDGLRVVDFQGKVSDPIGVAGTGVTVPFIYSLVPSRMCAAFNRSIYRVQVQNGNATGSPQQQWWYDFSRGVWSGPHSQAASLMAAYSNTFVVTLQDGGAMIFQSDVVQNSTSTFVENGTQLQFNYATPMLPDTDQMSEVAMVLTTVHMALVAGNDVQFYFANQDGEIIDAGTITPTGPQSLWGAVQWGHFLWGGAQLALYPQQLAWEIPIVFRRGQIVAFGNCASGFKIGRIHMLYRVLQYLQQQA